MNLTVIAVLGIGVTVGLALIAWLINALLFGGKAATQISQTIQQLTEFKSHLSETQNALVEIRHDMLRPTDLENVVLKMQIELHKVFYSRKEGEDLEIRIRDIVENRIREKGKPS